jgi:putative oxidoreductase
MAQSLSRATMPTLRIGTGIFLLAWGIDKLAAVQASQRIFAGFYHITAGPALLAAAGTAEILIAIALIVGLFRRSVAWIVLAMNAVSTAASRRQILDPWGWLGLGPGGTHLFLASIVIMAASVVLVVNAHDSTLTLDSRLNRP